ncbi:1685_t:CDS:2, partial [Ambispora leptoticha]
LQMGNIFYVFHQKQDVEMDNDNNKEMVANTGNKILLSEITHNGEGEHKAKIEVKTSTKDPKKLELEVRTKDNESESRVSEIAENFSVHLDEGENPELVMQFEQRSSGEINIDDVLEDIQHPTLITEPPSAAASPPQITEVPAEETIDIVELNEEQQSTTEVTQEQQVETTSVKIEEFAEAVQESANNIFSMEIDTEDISAPLQENVFPAPEKKTTLDVMEIVPREVERASTATLINEGIVPVSEKIQSHREISKKITEEPNNLQLSQPIIIIDYKNIEELEAKCVNLPEKIKVAAKKRGRKPRIHAKATRKPKEKDVEENTAIIKPPAKRRRARTKKNRSQKRRKIIKSVLKVENAVDEEKIAIQEEKVEKEKAIVAQEENSEKVTVTQENIEKEKDIVTQEEKNEDAKVTVTQEEKNEKEKVVTPAPEEKAAIETEKTTEHPSREQLVLEVPQETTQKHIDKLAVKENELTLPETVYSKELYFEIPIHQSSQEFITEFSTTVNTIQGNNTSSQRSVTTQTENSRIITHRYQGQVKMQTSDENRCDIKEDLLISIEAETPTSQSSLSPSKFSSHTKILLRKKQIQ